SFADGKSGTDLKDSIADLIPVPYRVRPVRAFLVPGEQLFPVVFVADTDPDFSDITGHAPAPGVYAAGDTLVAPGPGNLVHPSGYPFLGWATYSGATSADYVPGAIITVEGPLVLYPVWQLA
ncbi:MAG: hypothetical protein D6B26_01585, partial [Spirochaetaceae bacterium]